MQVGRDDESVDEEFAVDVGDRRGVGDANFLVAAVEFERFTRREASGGGRNVERPIGRRRGDGVVERRGGGGGTPEGFEFRRRDGRQANRGGVADAQSASRL